MKISIIGVGRLGGALALAAAAAEYPKFTVENLFARGSLENARKIAELVKSQAPQILGEDRFSEISSDVVFITTQDAEIKSAAANLARQLKSKPLVFHASGALSSDVLGELRKIGCAVGSIHPLVSVSDASLGARSFSGAFFCVEGDARAVNAAKKIVKSLGGKPFSIATEYKTLYHAAAVTACGHLVATIDVALEMLEKCGLPEIAAREILLPLIKSTVENLETQTTAQALTGTFARGDAETLTRQIETLRENVSHEALDIFLRLGERSLQIAKRRNAAAREKLETISEIIRLAKKNSR